MVRESEIRNGEVEVAMPATTDVGLVFIGRIRTPWTWRLTCPRQGRQDGPTCRVEVFEPWIQALDGIGQFSQLELLYWLHLSRHDLVLQSPKNDGSVRGTFSLRSPVRPNPIATAMVKLVAVEGRRYWCAGSTVSTAPRSSTSSPIAASSRRSRRRSPVIPKSAIRRNFSPPPP